MKIVTTRAAAFSDIVEDIRCRVDDEGNIGVFDNKACYYTTCHNLSAKDCKRINKLAKDK